MALLDTFNEEKKEYLKNLFQTRGGRSYYIQVTADISNADTWTREVRPYIMLNDQVQKVLVINRPIINRLF